MARFIEGLGSSTASSPAPPRCRGGSSLPRRSSARRYGSAPGPRSATTPARTSPPSTRASRRSVRPGRCRRPCRPGVVVAAASPQGPLEPTSTSDEAVTSEAGSAPDGYHWQVGSTLRSSPNIARTFSSRALSRVVAPIGDERVPGAAACVEDHAQRRAVVGAERDQRAQQRRPKPPRSRLWLTRTVVDETVEVVPATSTGEPAVPYSRSSPCTSVRRQGPRRARTAARSRRSGPRTAPPSAGLMQTEPTPVGRSPAACNGPAAVDNANSASRSASPAECGRATGRAVPW